MKSTKPWYFNYIKSRIDQVWGWCPMRKEARQRAYGGNDGADYWICEKCASSPLRKGAFEIDHIVPRMNTQGWDGWDRYVERSFCSADGLKILCKPCHLVKSKAENVTRRKTRSKKASA